MDRYFFTLILVILPLIRIQINNSHNYPKILNGQLTFVIFAFITVFIIDKIFIAIEKILKNKNVLDQSSKIRNTFDDIPYLIVIPYFIEFSFKSSHYIGLISKQKLPLWVLDWGKAGNNILSFSLVLIILTLLRVLRMTKEIELKSQKR